MVGRAEPGPTVGATRGDHSGCVGLDEAILAWPDSRATWDETHGDDFTGHRVEVYSPWINPDSRSTRCWRTGRETPPYDRREADRLAP